MNQHPYYENCITRLIKKVFFTFRRCVSEEKTIENWLSDINNLIISFLNHLFPDSRTLELGLRLNIDSTVITPLASEKNNIWTIPAYFLFPVYLSIVSNPHP